jgi:hypothetical protein
MPFGKVRILLADGSRRRDGRPIAGERLRHALVVLPYDGTLCVELRIVQIGFRQRRLQRLREGRVRRDRQNR